MGADTIAWDSLENENMIFREKMKKYTSSNTLTLSYRFDSLLNDGFDIVTSSDSLFRIYSWNTWRGGTMQDFENLYQFNSGAKIQSKLIYNSGNEEEENYIPFYKQLYTIKAKDKTYYLAIFNSVFSSKDAGEGLKAFSIENNELNDNIKLFKTKDGLSNFIFIDYDISTLDENSDGPYNLVQYDQENKIVTIPLFDDDGKLTRKNIQYKFNGNFFEVMPK